MRVATGTLVDAPVFAGAVDVEYTSTVARIAAGPELPTAAGVLRDLTLSGDQGVDLAADVTVEGTCTIAAGGLFTGAHSLILGDAATLVEAAGATVIGTVLAARTVDQGVGEAFGGIGLEILAAGAAPGLTQVVRTTGATVDKDARDGIFRFFDVVPAHNANLDAGVVFGYDETELDVIAEEMLVLYTADGGTWVPQPSVLDVTANTVSAFGLDSLTRLTLGSQGVVATVLRSSAVAPSGAAIAVTWSLADALPGGDFIVYRLEGQDRTPVRLADAVVESDGATYRVLDAGGAPGTTCRYRVDVTQGGHTWTLFESAPVLVPRPVFSLDQNYPNPFNPMTSIEYSLPRSGRVTLDVYDVAGRRVVRLVDAVRAAGPHAETWTGLDQAGNPAPSGTYFYRMTSGDRTLVRKMSLVR
ncbi:MAG: FlgD immunoglobulin-like domain containing protein [Candidatus Krumholzibacteriia bacterium]